MDKIPFLAFLILPYNSAITLPKLSVQPDTISVSGISSGGCFATQFHVAFSGTVNGVGSFAGCPFLSGPLGLDVPTILVATLQLAADGAIDPVAELAGDEVYIFQGHTDPIVPWENAHLIHQFYSEFTEEERINEKSDSEASHGFPTTEYGCKCDQLCPPLYINNCNYDGAMAVIQQMLSSANDTAPAQAFDGTLFTFDQEEFFEGNAHGKSMASQGYLYVPDQCATDQLDCHLHFNFHGCTTGSSWVGDSYIQHSGLLQAADANNVVIVFPQALPSFANPLGCWDWWGYLGDTQGHAFATKSGLQMQGVAAMLQRVSGVAL